LVVTDLMNRVFPSLDMPSATWRCVVARMPSAAGPIPFWSGSRAGSPDYLRTRNGEWVSGISLTEKFRHAHQGIKQIQIVQDRADHLLLRIVFAESADAATERRSRIMCGSGSGDRMKYTIEKVPRIEPEKSGKYRFSIYLLDRDRRSHARSHRVRVGMASDHIVIDSFVNGSSSGGTRIASDVALEEVAVLAREMTFKFPLLSPWRGGAKCGIKVPPA